MSGTARPGMLRAALCRWLCATDGASTRCPPGKPGTPLAGGPAAPGTATGGLHGDGAATCAPRARHGSTLRTHTFHFTFVAWRDQ